MHYSARTPFKQLFATDSQAKFGIFNSPQSSDIGRNSDADISDFRIFSQILC